MEWRLVVGYEAFYEVSDQGDVRSLPRRVGAKDGGTRVRKPHVLRPIVWKNQHWRVRLTDASGVAKERKVHHLVAAAFLGPRPAGMGALHKDDDKSRNCLANLYYGTPAQNTRDKMANGKHRYGISLGEKHGQSRLTEKDIPEILRMREGGMTFRALAAAFDMSEMAIQSVVRGRSWGGSRGSSSSPGAVAM